MLVREEVVSKRLLVASERNQIDQRASSEKEMPRQRPQPVQMRIVGYDLRLGWLPAAPFNLFLFSFSLILKFLCLFVLFFPFGDVVSLCSPGSSTRTHFVDLTGQELRDLPGSVYQVLELKGCSTTTRLNFCLFNLMFFKSSLYL